MGHPRQLIGQEINGMTLLGVNTRSLSFPHGREDIIVVLMKGHNNDVCCYMAGGSDADFAARSGDKINLMEAAIHFPQIEAELTRMKLSYREL